MTARSLTKTALALLLAGTIFTGTAQAAEMTKEQVEAIVQEYITNHADVILKSVDDFQRKSIASRQADALKQNHDELFRNERSPFIGNIDGDVTIVEFFDYNCGYCKHTFPEIKTLIADDKNVKVVMKDFPILGPMSEVASKWALAAQKQDKYFAFHQKMMENRQPLTQELIEKVAKEIGLDAVKAKKDAESTEVMVQIEKNRSLAGQLGLGGTPAFVVGDEIIPGAADAATLKEKIAALRSKKTTAPAPVKKDETKPAPAEKEAPKQAPADGKKIP